MGHGHAVTGAAAWVTVAGIIPALIPGATAQSLPLLAAGTVITAGAALLPDVDHPQGTISHSFRPFSKWICDFARWISGGHRHGTHSLLGVLAFGIIATLLTVIRIPSGGAILQIGTAALAALLTCFAAKSLRLVRGWASSWTFGLAGGVAAMLLAPPAVWWLPAAVTLGVFVHIVGDGLTTQGVPLFWPWNPRPKRPSRFWKNNGYFAFPVLGNAGSWREFGLVGVLYAYIIAGFFLTPVIGSDGGASLFAETSTTPPLYALP